jgi:hypothetical protein
MMVINRLATQRYKMMIQAKELSPSIPEDQEAFVGVEYYEPRMHPDDCK